MDAHVLTELEATIGKLDRTATTSIRGYLTQLTYTALQWLRLKENEILLVEGREDLDKFMLGEDGEIHEISETQVKDLSKAINVRSDEVWRSVFNFMLSYCHYKKKGNKVRFKFATTAKLKRQNVSASGDTTKTDKPVVLHLEIDVLKAWASLSSEQVGADVDALKNSIKQLFDKHLLRELETETVLGPKPEYARDVKQAIDFLESENAWCDFFVSVDWHTNMPSASELEEAIYKEIVEAFPTKETSASLLSQVLVYQVILKATKPDVTQRVLTCDELKDVISSCDEELYGSGSQFQLSYLNNLREILDAKLARFDQKFEKLKSKVDEYLPSDEKSWGAIREFSRLARRHIKTKIGNIHIDQSKQLDEVDKILCSKGIIVVQGGSGTGKSALTKLYAEKCDSDGALILWLNAASLERPDLPALESDLKTSISIAQAFNNHDSKGLLVLDGLDRVFEPSALQLVANLLDVLNVNGEKPQCRAIITCQTADWPEVKNRLHDEDINTVNWDLYDYSPPVASQLAPLWDAYPKLIRLKTEPKLSKLLGNLKIIDLIATRAEDMGPDEELVSENSIAHWFWKKYVARGTNKYVRSNFLLKLSEKQADNLRSAISICDLSNAESLVLLELENDKLIFIDENGRLSFSHDLYADWGRLRLLILKQDQLVDYLQSRTTLPLWLRAIRLLGIELLNGVEDSCAWRNAYASLRNDCGEATSDLFLDAIIFSTNPGLQLDQLKEELLAEEGVLLRRFLKRFLVFATSTGVFGLLRYTSSLCWPDVLRFLHEQCNEVIGLATTEIARVAEIWLTNTQPSFQLRKEAGEIALAIGRYVLHKNIPAVDDKKSEFLALALSAVPECREQVFEFARHACERSTEIQEQEFNGYFDLSTEFNELEYLHSDAAPNNTVEASFRTAVLIKGALNPVIKSHPALASEVILACLLTPKSIKWPYLAGSKEFAADVDNLYQGPVLGYFHGPFYELLQSDFEQGLMTIHILVEQLCRSWGGRREYEKEPAVSIYLDDSCDGVLNLELNGKHYQLPGDCRTLGWSAGLGSPTPPGIVTSALMALEQYCYTKIDTKGFDDILQLILDKALSVPVLHVLLDIGRGKKSLFRGPLLPLLGISELYDWEIKLQALGRRHLNMGLSFSTTKDADSLREFNALEHRKLELGAIAQKLFLKYENVREFYEGIIPSWRKKVAQYPDGEFAIRQSQRAAMFCMDNYSLKNAPKGKNTYCYTPPQCEQQSAIDEGILAFPKLIGFLEHCTWLLKVQSKSNEAELEDFMEQFTKAHDLSQNCFDAATNDLPAYANESFQEVSSLHLQESIICGGIAVLMNRHFNRVMKQPERFDWCKESLLKLLSDPPKPGGLDHHDNPLEWSWDCFAVGAVVAMWQHEPESSLNRELLARLAFTHHNKAIARLVFRIENLPSERFDDLLRIRRLVFECAHGRGLHRLLQYVSNRDSTIKKEDLEHIRSETIKWRINLIKDFVHEKATLDEFNWELFGNQEVLTKYDDTMLAGVSLSNVTNYWDLELIFDSHASAFNLKQPISLSERRYRISFLRQLAKHIVKTLKSQTTSKYVPFEDYKMPEQLASALSEMEPADKPEDIGKLLLSVAPLHADWADIFLSAFYTDILDLPALPAHIPALCQRFISEVVNFPVEQHWSHKEAVWSSLYGICPRCFKFWDTKHAELAAKLWNLIQERLTGEHIDEDFFSNVVGWLCLNATTQLRIPSVAVLNQVIGKHSENWTPSDKHTLESGVANLLTILWFNEKKSLQNSPDHFSAFLDILKWLSSRQNEKGLRLLSVVGELS